jgi:UDP-2,3-diacylglucosamine pyrophosphatase LpxH
MKILFLSDLHLGSPLFESEDKILSLLEEEYFRVFFIGDIIDVWEDNLVSIVADNQNLLKKINELKDVIIIKGNHDPDISTLESVFYGKYVNDMHSFKVDDKSILVIHGDEFDWLVTKYSWLAKLLFPIHWILERFGINLKGWFRDLFCSISSKRDKKYYNELVLDMEKELFNKYKGLYDCIVVGHTHLPKIIREDDFIYVNCGDWVHNKTYVIYEDGQFILKGE